MTKNSCWVYIYRKKEVTSNDTTTIVSHALTGPLALTLAFQSPKTYPLFYVCPSCRGKTRVFHILFRICWRNVNTNIVTTSNWDGTSERRNRRANRQRCVACCKGDPPYGDNAVVGLKELLLKRAPIRRLAAFIFYRSTCIMLFTVFFLFLFFP